MTGPWFEGVPARGWVLIVLALAAFVAAPWFVSEHVLTILVTVLFFAYMGIGWNVMMGFAGQLSLGHALYVGLGAYVSAALYVHFGLSPWLGLPIAVAASGLAGAVIGFLAFRFRIGGVYFAILTVAFAEFARIGFDHFAWVNGSGGLFLPVESYTRNDLWNLRGGPQMFYHLLLALTAGALLASHLLLRSRIGYFWQAIREDETSARALGIDTFRCKMLAVVISAAMTSVAGVVFAFYYNSLFPEQVFHISRSIELILAPIVGGLGTLFGPLVGAILLTGLAETIWEAMSALGWTPPGAKQVFYGLCLLAVVMLLPEGIWPPLARRLGLTRRPRRPEL